MDLFQIFGDLLHMMAMIILLFKILETKNVTGVSYKTQQIYGIVYVTRYIDVFLGWKTFYLFFMKFLFAGLAAFTCYHFILRKPYCLSYHKQLDSFPHYFLYIGAVVMTMIIHKSFLPIQLLWSFSQWLQAFAILPQLFMISKNKTVSNITAHYVLLMALYRILYVFHWIYAWNHVIWTSFLAGVLQSLLYADFIYYYFKSNKRQKDMYFPV